MVKGVRAEEEIDEQTWGTILKLMELLGCDTPEEALNIALNRSNELTSFSMKRYGLPAKEARERFWEEVEELSERSMELEEELKDQKMLREMLCTRLCILYGDH